MNINPETLLDAYKLDHRRQFHPKTSMIFSNFTPRGSRVEGVDKVILFGLRYFVKRYLIDEWNQNFFSKPVEEVKTRFARRVNNYLGPNGIGTEHIEELHKLGYLPLEIMSLPEGSAVNLRVPMFVVFNTDPRFFWLTNYIETILSTTVWGPCTSATTANMYRQKLTAWAEKTNPEMKDFVAFQGHDFSFRGHFCMEAAVASGAAHLTSFAGTDTVPAVDFLEEYYGADSDKEMVGVSVPATEHSVASSLSHVFVQQAPADMSPEEKLRWGELQHFKHLITEVYPSGIVSIVSDTYDLFEVVNPKTGFVKELRDVIMARNGKTVIRPDTGCPVKIVTGWTDEEVANAGREISEVERKGLIECLWDVFGGTTTSKGQRQLDEHIGGIYGDSITLERCEQICKRLAQKGFASTNLVYGIGSFTYQGAVTPNAIITRDTYGFAVKATYCELTEDGEVTPINIFKDPKTDDGLKKSATGLTAVYETENGFELKDKATWDEVRNCALKTVFKDGQEYNVPTLAEIRERIKNNG